MTSTGQPSAKYRVLSLLTHKAEKGRAAPSRLNPASCQAHPTLPPVTTTPVGPGRHSQSSRFSWDQRQANPAPLVLSPDPDLATPSPAHPPRTWIQAWILASHLFFLRMKSAADRLTRYTTGLVVIRLSSFSRISSTCREGDQEQEEAGQEVEEEEEAD